MALIVKVLLLATAIPGFRCSSYVQLLERLDKTKCAPAQYSALIIGNTVDTDCGENLGSRLYFPKSTFELDYRRGSVPAGTVLITRNCLVSCVVQTERGKHAEGTVIANSNSLLAGRNFERGFLITYFPPCSGGTSRYGTADCATRIAELCQKYKNRFTIITGTKTYSADGYQQASSTNVSKKLTDSNCVSVTASPLPALHRYSSQRDRSASASAARCRRQLDGAECK